MIKLNRPTKPTLLQEKEEEWKKTLLEAIEKYGSYKKIPSTEKSNLIKHYKEDEIRIPLFKSTNNKCSFCECYPAEGGDVQVEHFNPKSLYPEETFAWENLMPICLKCNRKKSNHDTKLESLINPYLEDPEDFLDFDSLRIVAKTDSLDRKKSRRSIDTYNLNRVPLYTPRAILLVSLHEYENILDKHLDKVEELKQKAKILEEIEELEDSLYKIENLQKNTSKYSFFVKNYLQKSKSYRETTLILKQHRD